MAITVMGWHRCMGFRNPTHLNERGYHRWALQKVGSVWEVWHLGKKTRTRITTCRTLRVAKDHAERADRSMFQNACGRHHVAR